MKDETRLLAPQTVDLTAEDNRFRALNSASSLMRRKLCPGSALAEAGLPNEKTEFSAEGDLLHWHDEHPEADRTKLTHEQRGALDRNKWMRDRFLTDQLQRLQIPENEPFKHFTEFEMFLGDDNGVPLEPPFPGHTDHIYYYPRVQVAIIFDSKFGRLEVPKADVNMQLRAYAVMFSEMFECSEIFCAITQPWLPAPYDFTAVDYTADMIPEYKKEIIAIIEATKRPDAPRVPSNEACLYCKAKAFCRESLAVNTDLAVQKISDLTLEELEAIGDDIERAKKVIEAWEARIRYIAEKKPELLKKYELADVQESKSITDPYAAYCVMKDPDVALLAEGDEGLKEFLSCCGASRNQLELMVSKHREITIADAKVRLGAALGGIIETKVKQRSIKKIRSSRG